MAALPPEVPRLADRPPVVRRLEDHLREVLHLGVTPLAALRLGDTPLAVLPLEIPRQTTRGLGGLPTARLTADGLRTALPAFSSICWTSFIWTMWTQGTCCFWGCCF